MKRLLSSRPVDQVLRGAALVVTDRRWAAPLSAAALGFGIFAGVAIGPGTAGSLATGAQQIIELPSSGGDGGQSGGGGGGVASTESAAPPLGGGGGGFEEALPSTVPLAPEPIESLPPPATEPAPKAVPANENEPEEETEGQMFKGTVVHVSPAAGSYAMAIDGGELIAIHAPELPDAGAQLSGPLRQLANSTYAEAAELEEKKTVKEATFSGTVTFVDANPTAPAYTVSGRGSSLPVQVEPDPSGAVPELPAVGSLVKVTARIEPPAEPKGTPTLLQGKLAVESVPAATYFELAGIVKEVVPDTGQLLFSADWAGGSESTLTLAVPQGIDSAKLKLGDSYLATAEIAADGSLELKGIASDERTKGADDSAGAQGDLKR